MILKYGDRSQVVRNLQRDLNTQGSKLFLDGVYGDATEAAVRAYQLKVGLVSDGVAGPKTLASLQGADTGKLLKHADLVQASGRLGVPVATLYALNEVESKGRGFLDNGKPVILFERHVMHQRLRQRAVALARVYPALVNPKPGGYIGGTAEHQRLSQARQLDDIAALESASWGAFQVMGYHWQRLGYACIHSFVEAMQRSEADHLEALMRFIEADARLHKALKELQWSMVAKRYNGPDYRRNLYDVKLERAFERHQGRTQVAA
ncbi:MULTISPECIES: N-acetylmuramidase domain-containing protein [Pseudomonas]|uniref:N-acetylmuramidase domain-containing protein n=1 Tax=Pseudomonas TaxID=286 RepID=UPI001E2F4426|nr:MULTISPECIES: N-acetylmuramidase domain-containing protein [Pseudomonas]MCE1113725.1 N-acetylmuramidase domain-containing protein [Pseudomonas sp. NMI795_08]